MKDVSWFALHSLCNLLSYRTQDHQPRMAQPTMSWVLPHQSLSKKMPTSLSSGQSDGGICSIVGPSSQMALASVKLAKTQSEHRTLFSTPNCLVFAPKRKLYKSVRRSFVCVISFYRRQYVHRIYLAFFFFFKGRKDQSFIDLFHGFHKALHELPIY